MSAVAAHVKDIVANVDFIEIMSKIPREDSSRVSLTVGKPEKSMCRWRGCVHDQMSRSRIRGSSWGSSAEVKWLIKSGSAAPSAQPARAHKQGIPRKLRPPGLRSGSIGLHQTRSNQSLIARDISYSTPIHSQLHCILVTWRARLLQSLLLRQRQL